MALQGKRGGQELVARLARLWQGGLRPAAWSWAVLTSKKKGDASRPVQKCLKALDVTDDVLARVEVLLIWPQPPPVGDQLTAAGSPEYDGLTPRH